MNRRHFAQIATRLRRRWRSRPTAVVIAATGILAVAGLVWHKMQWRGGPCAAQATFADSPAWEPVRPEWPGHLPGVPDKGQATTAITPVVMPAPLVECSPATASAPVPSVAAGPEIFNVTPGPAAASQASSSPWPATSACPVVNSRPPELTRPQIATVPVQPLRSEAMEMIARQADEKVREGMDLADRGSCFAARADFIAALRLLAQGLDNDEGSTRHSQSLGAALTAMKEAQDFLPAPGKVEGELELAPIVAGHRTPLLKNVPPQYLQAMRAMKQYFSFAQEQLCLAAGHEVSGSMALRSLGKLHAAMADKGNPEMALPEAKAITFYQAAMLVCPRNYMAANDLGVLLAAQERLRRGPLRAAAQRTRFPLCREPEKPEHCLPATWRFAFRAARRPRCRCRPGRRARPAKEQ